MKTCTLFLRSLPEGADRLIIEVRADGRVEVRVEYGPYLLAAVDADSHSDAYRPIPWGKLDVAVRAAARKLPGRE